MRRIGATLLDDQGTVLTGLSPYYLKECTWEQSGTATPPEIVGAGETYTVLDISGAGILFGLGFRFHLTAAGMWPSEVAVKIVRDGTEFVHSHIRGLYFANGAQTDTLPAGVWVTRYDDTNKEYAVALVGMHIPFTSSLSITVRNYTPSGADLELWYGYVVAYTG